MTTPMIIVELINSTVATTHRIKVNVTDNIIKIFSILNDNRGKSLCEHDPVTVVNFIILFCKSGIESLHERGDGICTGFNDQVIVIVHDGPSEALKGEFI
jgi:hypothetical protein